MSRFADYQNKYSSIRMERTDGILLMSLHTGGAPVRVAGVKRQADGVMRDDARHDRTLVAS